MKKFLQKIYDCKALGVFVVIALLLWGANTFGQTVSVTISASGSWTPPAGVTSIQVEAWGGGGGGGGATANITRAGGGGGGGSYVKYNNVAVTNTAYTITIGTGGIAGTTGSAGSNGGNGVATTATFGATTVIAVGGIGGNGQSLGSNANASNTWGVSAGGPAVSTGNSAGALLSYYGGAGATGIGGTRSGGGGGAAGELSNGGTASAIAVTGGIYGGANASPYGIGAAGNFGTAGTIGNLPGGGGSGGSTNSTTSRAGGAGAAGQVLITYTPTTPTITLTPSALTGFATSTNSVSSTKTIDVSGANLTTDIIITPSTNFEISTSSTSGFGSSITIPFGSGTVAVTPIYVRVKSGATAGLLSEAVTFTSALAPTQSLTCSGTVVTNYYYKGDSGTGFLATLSNWGTNSDGTGTNPPDFGSTTNYQSFIITNTASVTTNTSWTLGAVASSVTKLILGDSSKLAVSLTISSGFPITLGTNVKLDLAAASLGSNEVIFQDATLPTLGTIDPSANITYATNGATGVTGTACNILKITNNTVVTLATNPNCKFLVVDFGSSITAASGFIITIATGGNVIINGSVTGARSQGIFTTDALVKGTIYGVDLSTPITLGASSTIIYNRASAQIISPLTYANLEILCPAVVLTTDITVNNNLTVGLLGSVTVSAGKNLTVNNALSNNATAGAAAVVVESGANLIQGSATTVNINTGNITVKRNSNALHRLDYTMWSSPVDGAQTLADFSPLTSQSPNRFFTFDSNGNQYAATAFASPFVSGTGYLIRMPNTDPTTNYDAGTAPLNFLGVFAGKPNNGNFGITTVATKYNALGNPYPSVIDADLFKASNPDINTLYFWRKTNNPNQGTSPTTSYASYNIASATGTGVAPDGAAVGEPTITPDKYIQVGQGFLFETALTSVVFNNAMRVANNGNKILKTKQIERSRIWLNLSNSSWPINQMALCYMDGALVGVDETDSKYINDSPVALTSKIENGEYIIQGRPTFDATDVVALNFKTNAAGDYTIAIDHTDGVFAAGQDVYLSDSKTGTETNLKTGSYTFAATAGIDNARFSLKYQKTLAIDTQSFDDNSISVYATNGTLYVNSKSVAISNITVFDVQGRLIAEQMNVKATSAVINNIRASNQVLIVKITGEDKSVITKKVVN